MTQFYDPKTRVRKNWAKKLFHEKKTTQIKLSKLSRNQNKQHYQSNHWSGTSKKKLTYNDFSYRFYFKENAFIWKYLIHKLALIYLPHIFSNSPESNLLLAFSKLVHHQFNGTDLLLLSTLRCEYDTIPLLLSTRNGSKSSRFRINSL